ncbi:hypothetical protein IE983_24900 [Enterobacter hormaechei]|uniref:Uncharacterized protein n=1 Tax=Enterobacter hormaechei TaxID=158836 RepID=A0A927DI06_9ENTR|nr:hypothetical protein [Enterobacter hormaechei]
MSPTGVTNRTDQARQPISAITGAGVRFSFDNRTKQALSLGTGAAAAVGGHPYR